MGDFPYISYFPYACAALPLIAILCIISGSSNQNQPKKSPQPLDHLEAPNLPEEIWREIFIYAYEKRSHAARIDELHADSVCGCNNDRAFDWPFDHAKLDLMDGPGRYGDLDAYKSEHECERRRLRKSFKARLRFARVSRMHWNVASEFLYRDLRVYDCKAAVHLALLLSSRKSLTRNAILLWTRGLQVRLIGYRGEDVPGTSEALQAILYSCPDLHSVSIIVHPQERIERRWSSCTSKIARCIPQRVQSLELQIGALGSLDAGDVGGGEHTALSFLRVENITGYWNTGSLTHLYITNCDFSMARGAVIDLPSLFLLHLGAGTILNELRLGLIFKGVPNLRVFEYHYITDWPGGVWMCSDIPPSLEKISVKTFAGSDEDNSFIFREFNDRNVQRFFRHLAPLFSAFPRDSPSIPTPPSRRPVPVVIMFPRTTRGFSMARHAVLFRPVGHSVTVLKDMYLVRCGASDDMEGWLNGKTCNLQ